MKIVTIVICVTMLTTSGLAQEEEPDGLKHSLTVEFPNFLLKTISVSYNYKINDKYELRFNPQVSFDWQQDNVILSTTVVKDPFWYYNSYMFQVGLSRTFHTVYIESLLYFKHGSFHDRTMQMADHGDDSYNTLKLSREYDGGGAVLRSGFKVDKNHLRFNFFSGIGYYLRYYHEEIQWSSGGASQGVYPRISNYWKDGLSVHFGFEIGYRFGMTDNEKMGWPF